MGGILVCPREPGEPLEEIENRYRGSIDTFSTKGLALDRRLVRDRYIVYRYRKLRDPHSQVLDLENGAFALAAGTMFYKGQTGTPALASLYQDWESGTVDLDEGLQGNFCLLLANGDRLTLLNDYTGYYPVYADESCRVVSSSLIATGRAVGTAKPNVQGFYELLLNGFVAGTDTVLDGVTRLDSRCTWELRPYPARVRREPRFEPFPPNASRDEIAEAAGACLLSFAEVLHRAYPHSIGAALSAGYDTRLMLALLRRIGASPYLYVYGREADDDVRIALMIGAGEGLTVEHIDKSKLPRADIETFSAQTQRDLFLFDGIKALGTLDDGSDVATRGDRAQKAALQLNGAGGEIYREIWNLGDRRTNLEKFLRMRFDRGRYDFCRSPFHADDYFDRFTRKVAELLDIDRTWIERREAEMLFPFLRNSFAAPNNAANNQFSPALVPFMEPALIFPSFDVPIRYKYSGELQAAILRRIDPALAAYPSGYGIDFAKPAPLAYRAKRALERRVPLWLRLAKRRRAPDSSTRPYFLSGEYLSAVLDLHRLRVSEWIDPELVGDPEALNRALSVELLLNAL